jgi:hypothetical protein
MEAGKGAERDVLCLQAFFKNLLTYGRVKTWAVPGSSIIDQ